MRHKITWKVPPENLDYNPLFVIFIHGLIEDCHPYRAIVENGLNDLIQNWAKSRILPLMATCIPPLRTALSLKSKVVTFNSGNVSRFAKCVQITRASRWDRLFAFLEQFAASDCFKDNGCGFAREHPRNSQPGSD